MSWSFASVLRSGEMDTAAVVRHCRELGVDAVELMDAFIGDEQVEAVREALAETGASVPCYDLSADFVQADDAARRTAVDEVRAGLARAAAFGAPLALVVPGTLKEGVSPAAARAWISEGLKECLSTADRLGIRLTIEDHSSQAAVYGRSEHLTWIRDRVGPQLAFTYDVGNVLLAGEDPLAALPRLAGHVAHVHFKDWHRAEPGAERSVVGVDGRCYTGVVLGAGIVDLAGAMAGLRRIGYDGHVSVEFEGVGDPRPAVRRGVELVRALLRTA